MEKDWLVFDQQSLSKNISFCLTVIYCISIGYYYNSILHAFGCIFVGHHHIWMYFGSIGLHFHWISLHLNVFWMHRVAFSLVIITFECILDALVCIFIDLIASGYSTELNWAETIKVEPTAFTLSNQTYSPKSSSSLLMQI